MGDPDYKNSDAELRKRVLANRTVREQKITWFSAEKPVAKD
jgi:hypothetical protein